ncbi:MAG: mtnD [Acidobacteria bacterium]|nr:mtnD [Acidobacteriota bacterium]
MAVVSIPDQNRTLRNPKEITDYLSTIGIDYERWDTSYPVPQNAPAEQILAAYAAEIDRLKMRGGYVTADVIAVNPRTPGLDEMLSKFNREHWHDEDEVRFVTDGRGIFHIHAQREPVVAIEVEAGDLIRVPRGMWHWFDLCADREIRAIRMFQDATGWTPHYTESQVSANYQPVCLGASYFPAQEKL